MFDSWLEPSQKIPPHSQYDFSLLNEWTWKIEKTILL